MLEVVAFDGDDTLWHNESLFRFTQEWFRDLLAQDVGPEELEARLLATEMRNLRYFGYGIKGFVLSMIETAIEVTDGRVPASHIQAIIERGKEMREHPVELLPGVSSAIEALAPSRRLMVITKGDLFDQESKIAGSGLADLFWRVDVVSEKDVASYRRVLHAAGIDPHGFVMVGNSVRSDILPVLELGATAVHIPYHVTWSLEVAEGPLDGAERYHVLESIADLPELMERLEAQPSSSIP